MSRRFKGAQRVRIVKKKSEGAQALALARRNTKKLKTVAEVIQATQETLSIALNATPIVQFFTPAGTGFKTRYTSVQVRGTVKRDVASALIDDWRLDLVLDREPNNLLPTALLMYKTATPRIGNFKNELLKRRFKVLRSASGVFGESGNGLAGEYIDWYVKLNLIAETDNENTFNDTDMIKNSIVLVLWTTATANQPLVDILGRLTCMDA